jgi:hypothetical protein
MPVRNLRLNRSSIEAIEPLLTVYHLAPVRRSAVCRESVLRSINTHRHRNVWSDRQGQLQTRCIIPELRGLWLLEVLLPFGEGHGDSCRVHGVCPYDVMQDDDPTIVVVCRENRGSGRRGRSSQRN